MSDLIQDNDFDAEVAHYRLWLATHTEGFPAVMVECGFFQWFNSDIRSLDEVHQQFPFNYAINLSGSKNYSSLLYEPFLSILRSFSEIASGRWTYLCSFAAAGQELCHFLFENEDDFVLFNIMTAHIFET